MATPTYTQAQLLSWLREESRLLDWDAIIVLQREPINALLLQHYIEHFNQDAYWSGIGGTVAVAGEDYLVAISDFTLDVPRLFYEDASLDNSRANLELAIIEGMQLSLRRMVDHWVITRIQEYSPTAGPRLFLDVLLAEVPGQIDLDRRIAWT